MFCPECHAEYREGFARCADCDVDLVRDVPAGEAAEQGSAGFDEPLVRLWMGSDPALYSALTAALTDAQIPFFDNPPTDFDNWLSAGSHAYTGVTMGLPNFDIQVPESHFPVAAGILQSLLGQAPPEPIE